MKRFSLFALVAFSGFAMAQSDHGRVGINTETPQATLDVVGFPDDVERLDGIIPPRLTGDELAKKKYSEAQNGSLVYITQPTDKDDAVSEVVTKGYYRFDGLKWQPLDPELVRKVHSRTGRDNNQYVSYRASVELASKTPKTNNGIGSVDLNLRGGWAKGTDSFSVVLGKADGESSIAMGLNAQAKGRYSIAFTQSIANGKGSVAFPNTYYNTVNEANGIQSVAAGFRAISNGHGSFALGNNVTSVSRGELVIGSYNKYVTPFYPDTIDGGQWEDGQQYANTVFQVGNGESSDMLRNAFTIWKNGIFKFTSVPMGLNLASPEKGSMVVTDEQDFKIHDGEKWNRFVPVTFATSAPTSPAPRPGDLYFNTSTKKYYAFDGSAWNPLW